MNNQKLSVSPLIYNNGNRNMTLKIDIREVCFMQDKIIINDKLKQLLLSDEYLTNEFLISMLHNTYKDETKTYYYSNYNAIKNYIKENKEIKDTLLTSYNQALSNDMIDSVINDYRQLTNYESIALLEALTRLLYIQDFYKDDEIGQQIDAKIKEWINYVNNYDIEKAKSVKAESTEEKEEELNKMRAWVLFKSIPPLIFLLSGYYFNVTPFMETFKDEDATHVKELITNFIENQLNDIKAYSDYSETITDFINHTEFNVNVTRMEDENEEGIKALREKYKVNIVKQDDGTNAMELNDLTDPFLEDYYKLYDDYAKKYELEKKYNDSLRISREKVKGFIEHLLSLENKDLNLLTYNYALEHLAFNDYQKKAYRIEEKKLKTNPQEIYKDNKILQATSKQLKAIDNARGGLVTYNETNTQEIENKIKEKQESLKNTFVKSDKDRLKEEIEQLKKELVIAREKEKELKDEYKQVCEYLNNIYKSMANEPKTSDYFKQLKRDKKAQEQRKRELERVIKFSAWQLDYYGRGNYELILNKNKKEKLRLTVENLSKQVARYTKEEQDVFDFLINKYLHNTNNKTVTFTLREYEGVKKRVRADKYLLTDIQAIRLLFREVWTYYTNDDTSYTFNEKHLLDNLSIKGQLVDDNNSLDDANLDTEISVDLTETLEKLLTDRDNIEYISTPLEIMQLNNDNEYLAKRLIKYLNYLVRIRKTSEIEISLDAIITELQHYGLKHFNMLDRHKTYKTEIVDVIDKTLSILEGDNHLNKQFIEVLDRQPFINYDNDYRGKSQETSINEWGKHKIKIKVFNLDDDKLLDTKKKQKKNKKTTKK